MADAPRKRSAFSKPGDSGSGGSGYSASSNYGSGSDGSLEPGNPIPRGQIQDENVYIPPPADVEGMPEKIKVDLTTPLEYLWVVLAIIALFAAFYFYSEGTYGHYSKHSRTHYPPQPHMLAYVPYALFAACLSFLSWVFTDNYYILNTRLRKIFYHFKFFGIVNVTEYLSTEQIFAIGVTGMKKHSKHRTWWEYKIVVIDKHGRFTDFSNSSRDDSMYELNSRARGMAAVIGCQFAECPTESNLRVQIENGTAQFIYFDHSAPLLQSFFGSQRGPDDVHPLVAFGAIAGTLLVIFAIAYFTSR